MRKALVGAGLVAVAAFTLGACGGDDDAGNKLAEKLAEEATGGDVDIDVGDDGGDITFEGEDGSGSISIGGGDMPDDLADFPLPDDAKVITSYSGSSDTSSGSLATVAANGDYEEVASDMKSALEADGFTISGTYDSESNGIGTATFTFEGEISGSASVTEDTTTTEGYNLSISIMTTQDMSTESSG